MKVIQMVVGVIPVTDEDGTKVLSVYRSPLEQHFGGHWFLPGRIIASGEEKSEIELLTDDFFEEFGVQFGLETKEKGRGSVFEGHLYGFDYHIIPLRGSLSSYVFKQKSPSYASIWWKTPFDLNLSVVGHMMGECLRQFKLL